MLAEAEAPVQETPAKAPAAKAFSSNTITVKFTNVNGWDNVSVYYWNGDGNNTWPGQAMTKVGTNEFSQDVYSCDIPDDVTGLIFNGKKHDTDYEKKTSDITTGIIDGQWWYVTGDVDDYPNGYGVVTYNVTVAPSIANGSVSADKTTNVSLADTVTLTATPDSHYVLDYFTVDGTQISGDSFVMPARNVTVSAVFKLETFTITFQDYDGTELQSGEWAYGAMPVYSGEMPTRAADAQYTYTFSGWDNELVAVTGNATYTATYTSTPRTYTVTIIADGIQHGTVTASPNTNVTAGTKVYVTFTPDPCYAYVPSTPYGNDENYYITESTQGNKQFLVADEGGKYFTMPAADVTINKVTFTLDHHTYGTPTYTWMQMNNGGYTCTASRVCSRDASHVDSETVTATSAVKTPATCTVKGWTTYTATFTNAAFTAQTNDVQDIPTIAHSLTPHAANAHTCTANGNIEYWQCSVCSKYFSDANGANEITAAQTVDPAAHTFGEWHEPVAATCTTTGSLGYKQCTVCNKYFNAQGQEITNLVLPVVASSHPQALTHVAAVAATCTTAGNIEYWYCPACDTYYSDNGVTVITQASTVVPAAHTFGEWHEAVPATCTTPGSYKYHTCSVCGESYGEQGFKLDSTEIPALGHDLVHHNGQPATCTEPGYEAYDTCSRCDYTTYTAIPALGHNIVDHECTRCHLTSVAKVGTTEYVTIEDAIAAWGPGKTLTLLANVTYDQTVVVEVNATKSTQNWTLNLGDYTWTANGCNAFRLYAAGGTVMNQNYGLKVYANENGGITAANKYCIECTYDTSTAGYRPRLEIHGGTYNGSYIIYYKSLSYNDSNVSNGPSVYFEAKDGSEPIFNGGFALAKCPIHINAGYFNGTSFNTYPVTSTADTNLNGGHFKTLSAFPDPRNNTGIIYNNCRLLFHNDGSVDVLSSVSESDYEAALTPVSVILSTNRQHNGSKTSYYTLPILFEKADYAIKNYSNSNSNPVIEIVLNANVVATQDKAISSGTYTIDATAAGAAYTGAVTLSGTSGTFILKGAAATSVTVTRSGYLLSKSVEGTTYTYSVLSTSSCEAKIGTVGYTTLEAAIAAAEPTDEITVLKNVTYLDKAVTANSTVTVSAPVTESGTSAMQINITAAGETEPEVVYVVSDTASAIVTPTVDDSVITNNAEVADLVDVPTVLASVAGSDSESVVISLSKEAATAAEKEAAGLEATDLAFEIHPVAIVTKAGSEPQVVAINSKAGAIWQFALDLGDAHAGKTVRLWHHSGGEKTSLGVFVVNAEGKVNSVTMNSFSVVSVEFAVASAVVNNTLTYYDNLADAIANADAGTTVTLLADATISQNGSTRSPISKSLTIDGQNHTITIGGRGFGVGMNASSPIDVTFKDVTIVNNQTDGRCIDTRGNLNSLTLNNTKLDMSGITATPYNQVLTIGGDQATAATVNIVNGSQILASSDGSKYYAIVTFNPVNMTIEDSTIKGWACIYAKGANNSAGSAGSVFNITDSTLVSLNKYSGATNDFCALMAEDNNVTFNITDTVINVSATGNQPQSIIGTDSPIRTAVTANLGAGNTVTLVGGAIFAINAGEPVVSGGTFNVEVPEVYCANGYIPNDNGDGTYGVKSGTYVARVDGQGYETFAEALAAANTNGGTLTLLADVALTTQQNITHSMTIDLNGHSITAADCRALHIQSGEVTITGTGTITSTKTEGSNFDKDSSVIRVGNNGAAKAELTLGANVTVAAPYSYGITVFGTNTAGVELVVNGKVQATGLNGAISGNGNSGNKGAVTINAGATVSSTVDAAIYHPQGDTLTINGGTISGPTAVYVKSGTVAISGGTLNGNGAAADYSFNGNGCNPTGDALVVDNCNYPGGVPTVSISGGSFTSAHGDGIGSYAGNNATTLATVTATGNDIDVGDDFKWVGDAQNGYTLVKKVYVAEINGQGYETLADAIAAVPANGTATTITMIGDETINVATGALTIAAGKNVVIDLNGHTVTGYCESGKASALITNYGTLTLKDNTDTDKDGTGSGKMYAGANPAWIYEGGNDYSGSYASNMIANRGNLTIESGYYESTTSGSAAYVIDNYSNGIVVINGGHLYNYHTNAIRLFCNSATAENSVTVNGGIIEGYCAIWVQGASESTEKGSLTINGGTIKTTEKAVVNGEKEIYEGSSAMYMDPSNANMSMTIKGGTFETNVEAWGDGKVTITGGVFEGYVYSETKTGFISGGVFTIEPDPKDIVQGKAATVRDLDGKYIIANAVAEIGTVGYISLEAALTYAEDGDTITLLANSTGKGLFIGPSKFTSSGLTIDFNGKTYTVETPVGSTGTVNQALHFEQGNKITLTGGTIDMTNDSSKLAAFDMVMQNYGTLVIEDMIIDGTGIAVKTYSNSYSAPWGGSAKPQFNYNTAGNSVIKDSTITVVGDIGIDDAAGLTIEDDATIIANKIVTKGTDERYASATPTITVENGATFKLADFESFDALLGENAQAFGDIDANGYRKVETLKVAQIGNVKYASLAEAIAAVHDNTATTITMIADERIDVAAAPLTIAAGKNIVLDLNGHEVIGQCESGETSALITNCGTLTIKDSSDEDADGTGTGRLITGATPTWIYDGSGNYAGSYASNLITNRGTLTVESGYLENVSTGSACYVIDNQTNGNLYAPTATVSGGTLKAVGTAIRLFCNSTTKDNTVIIDGGTIVAPWGVQLSNSNSSANKGSLTINGGVFNSEDRAVYLYCYNENGSAITTTITGGTFNGGILGYAGTTAAPATLNITGGTFNEYVELDSGTLNITGGEFNSYVYVHRIYGTSGKNTLNISNVETEGETIKPVFNGRIFIRQVTGDMNIAVSGGVYNDHNGSFVNYANDDTY